MADKFKIVGKDGNRHTDWTSEVVLERDEETGEVTKSVSATVPSELSAEDKAKLEDLGFEVKKATKAEVEEAETRVNPAVATGPIFGTSDIDLIDQGGEESTDNQDKK